MPLYIEAETAISWTNKNFYDLCRVKTSRKLIFSSVSRISSYVDILSHPINCKIACYNLKNLDKVMVT